MRLLLLLGYFYSFFTYGWDSFEEFGNFSTHFLKYKPHYFKENVTRSNSMLFRSQIRELEFEDIDFDTTGWRKDRIQKILNSGRVFDGFDEKNILNIGQIIIVKGNALVHRGKGNLKVKKGTLFKSGDLIETLDNGHLWLGLIDGTVIRIGPKSIYSLEFFEKSNEQLILFHRINNGNVHFLSRLNKSASPSSIIETDRIFYPFFNVLEFAKFLEFSNQNNFNSEKIHKEKFKFLNYLLKINDGFNRGVKVGHVINTPFLIFDTENIEGEFLVDWHGRDFVKLMDHSENLKIYKKNIKDLEEIKISEKNIWWEASLDDFKINNDSNLAWYGDFVIKDIPSIRIIVELLIMDEGISFFSKMNNVKLWDKHQLSEKKLNDRKNYLINYLNKQGASFLNERDTFVRTNKYEDEISLKTYLIDYYQYSSYFNRLFSELDIEFKISDSRNLLKKIIKFNKKMDYFFYDLEGQK